MSKKQKEIIEKMKLLITALESTMDQEPMAKSADGDWVNGQPKERPKRG